MSNKSLDILVFGFLTCMTFSAIQLAIFPGEPFNIEKVKQIEQWQGKKFSALTMFTDFCPGSINSVFDGLLPKIYANGNTPIISWMLIGCNNPLNILDLILNGSLDDYINQWLSKLKLLLGSNRKAYIRLGHEMNGSWYAYSAATDGSTATPDKFIRVWKKIKNSATASGLNSKIVQFIFCANNSDQKDQKMENYYPGNDYVDMVALDFYNWGTSQSWSAFLSPAECTLGMIERLRKLAPGKPLAVNEIASTSVNGSNKLHDIAAKANWLNQLCEYLKSSNIALYSYFNIDKETDWAIFDGKYGTDTYNGMNVYSEFKNCVSQPNFVSTLDSFVDSKIVDPQIKFVHGSFGYFQSFWGKYLAAGGGPNPFLNPLQDANSYWEIVHYGNNFYSFKSNTGAFLSGRKDKTVTMEFRMESWEKWKVEKIGNLKVWRSFHGTYLSARPEGWLSLVNVPDVWENWTQRYKPNK